MTRYVNIALLDTLADWEIGYLTSYVNDSEFQREPDAVRIRTVGATAAAGFLDDRPHTGPAKEFLASSGYRGTEHFVDELVVADGDLITANPVAPVEFARAVFERLGLYGDETLASWYKLYGRQDPQGFYELMSS